MTTNNEKRDLAAGSSARSGDAGPETLLQTWLQAFGNPGGASWPEPGKPAGSGGELDAVRQPVGSRPGSCPQPGAGVDRQGLEREPAARGHPDRLGRDRACAADRRRCGRWPIPAKRDVDRDRVQRRACCARRPTPGAMRPERWSGAASAGERASRRGRRQALRRAGMAQQPGVPDAEGPLPARVRGAAARPPGTPGADDAEEQRINFHLRQFVDAMSPSLMLLSNPVALRRAVETGGGQLRRRHAQPAGRPEAGPAQHGRCDRVRAGPQPGADAGQGRASQQADRADPIHADDRPGPGDAAAAAAAMDQQVSTSSTCSRRTA